MWDSSVVMKHYHIYLLVFIFVILVDSKLTSDDYEIRSLLRRRRYLLYPNPLDSETKVQVLFGLGLPMEGEVSMTLGYVLKCNYNLPYLSANLSSSPSTSSFSQKYILKEDEELKRNILSRWDLYRLFELTLESLGSGKACLLRSICETGETPFQQTHGLLGELLHIFLTPSSSHEPEEINHDCEYHAAELLGKQQPGRCKTAYSECMKSPLDYFTIV